jgi:hypothetical protein
MLTATEDHWIAFSRKQLFHQEYNVCVFDFKTHLLAFDEHVLVLSSLLKPIVYGHDLFNEIMEQASDIVQVYVHEPAFCVNATIRPFRS